jgi:RING-like zinc finger
MMNHKHNPYVGTFHGMNRKDFSNMRPNVVDAKHPLLPMFRHSPPVRNTAGIGLKSLLFEDTDIVLKPFVTQVQVFEKVKQSKKNISSEALKHLPLSIYDLSTSTQSTTDKGDLPICSICLECFKDGDELRTLECSHCYHRTCIDIWLIGCLSDELTNTCNCPQCRQVIGVNTLSQSSDIPSSVFLRIGESLSCVDVVSDITSESDSIDDHNSDNVNTLNFSLEEISDELLVDELASPVFEHIDCDDIDDILDSKNEVEEELSCESMYSDCGYPLK